MSDSGDSGPGRREVAHRLFAAEFDDADFSYSESDEERAPNYVVTPTGARVNRLFAVGVLTELEQVNEEVLRARIVDPTGPFVVYAGQYQPEALAFLEKATPPLFVAITGKARTFEPDDGDRVFTSIRPESISEVDAETRDRWVVQAAEQTVDRVARMAGAKESGLSGDSLQTALTEAGVEESDASGIALALEHYGTTGDYLQAVRKLSLDAARVVAGERDEAGTLSLSPGEGGDEPLASLAEVELDASETVDTADPASSESDAAESDTDEPEPEPTTDPVSEPDTASDGTETADQAGADVDGPATEEVADLDAGDAVDESAGVEDTGTVAGDSEPVADSSAVESSETTAADTSAESADDDVEDFDPEFELDEDEREEIESEYGTDFQSGSEVDEPGAAGIETPDPEELAEQEAQAAEESGSTVEADGSDADVTTADAGAADADEPVADAEDVDLEDAVMDVMAELNDGSGANRDAVHETVVEEYGADPDAVDDAIQDALMGGRCYEPEDGKLTPI